MNIVVQKFGGTSLAAERDREAVARQIESSISSQYRVVAVVSAMGRRGQPYATDTLLDLIGTESRSSSRELDLLMSCGEVISAVVLANTLRNRGHQVTVLNGQQAGIITDDKFGEANILEINPKRILHALEKSHIVIVTGYQGVTRSGEITTLGRGGSDTTALALGVALQASYVDIFTDVEGILTADPRIVPSARKLSHITYRDTYTFAHHGAKVIHPRAVKIAEQGGMPFRVRSMYSEDSGTLVSNSGVHLENRSAHAQHESNPGPVLGIAQRSGMSHFQLMRQDSNPSVSAGQQPGQNSQRGVRQGSQQAGAQVSRAAANEEHSLRKETQHEDPELSMLLSHLTLTGFVLELVSIQAKQASFTVSNRDVDALNHSIQRFGYPPVPRRDCAKIAAVGPNIQADAGVIATFFACLTEADVQVLHFGQATNAVWCLVPDEQMELAARCLHEAFIQTSEDAVARDLGNPPPPTSTRFEPTMVR